MPNARVAGAALLARSLAVVIAAGATMVQVAGCCEESVGGCATCADEPHTASSECDPYDASADDGGDAGGAGVD